MGDWSSCDWYRNSPSISYITGAISDVATPAWRASSMGVYRMWRDSGYAFGAIFAGVLTDLINVSMAMTLVTFFPLIAGMFIGLRMNETLIKE